MLNIISLHIFCSSFFSLKLLNVYIWKKRMKEIFKLNLKSEEKKWKERKKKVEICFCDIFGAPY